MISGLRIWLALSFAALMAGCSRTPNDVTTLTYGLTLAPTGIDPHINASAELGIPLDSVYDTLVVQDPESGKILPGLAERWEISPDGRTYTFFLRRDVRFHDGTMFAADDVVANLDYVVNPDHHSQKAVFLLGPFERAEVVDLYTVAIHLTQPFAPLLDSFSQVYLGMASPEALDAWGPAEYQFHQVGTGPYRFVEYVAEDRLILEKNSDYAWPPPTARRAQPFFDRIVFRFFEDPATRAIALENGDVDVLGEVPRHEAERLDASDGFTLTPVAIPGQPTQFLFNTTLPPTDDLRVRQALLAATDRGAIVNTVFGPMSPVAEGPLSSGLWSDPEAPVFAAFDPGEAAQLLETAGWTLGPNGRRSRDGTALKISIVTPGWGSHPEVAQLLESAWEALGAEVAVELAPGFGLLREAQTRGEYNLIGINFFGTDPDLLRPMYASDGLYNWTGYLDPSLDSMLAQAAALPLGSEERRALYLEVGRLLRSEALVLPIRDYTNLVVASDRVTGLAFAHSGWFPLLRDLQLAP